VICRETPKVTADHQSQLREVFSVLALLPDTEWKFFWSHVREARFDTGAHLIREGDRAENMHYIVTGLVRDYHNDDGAELVHGFDYEGRFCATYESFLTDDPAPFSIQALEPTHTLWFPGRLLAQLYDRHPSWDRIGRRLLENQFIRHQDKEKRFRRLKPEAHYKLLLARHSPLVTRVPLNQLASYLRITPETLSRIRARLRAREE
jgi:CRP-like cAMP-binding protein